MDNSAKRAPPTAGPEALERARRIDELMAGPVKTPPAVTVFGDEAVAGFSPAPRARDGAAPQAGSPRR